MAFARPSDENLNEQRDKPRFGLRWVTYVVFQNESPGEEKVANWLPALKVISS